MAEFLVITGLGGAGRTHAAHTLEDMGWFVIDNLPASLLSKVVDLANAPGSNYEKVALAVGYASRPSELLDEIERLDTLTGPTRMLFLHASTEALVNRYESTRRRHPAAQGLGLSAAIEAERASLEPILAAADVVIDTSNLSVHELARRIREVVDHSSAMGPQVTVTSFGFSKGVPRDADLVIDCRYLPNPHWVTSLRPLTGRDQAVVDYLFEQPIMAESLDSMCQWLNVVLPGYAHEGRAHFNLAFGCTGGQHRSVAVAEYMGGWLREHGTAAVVSHRELPE